MSWIIVSFVFGYFYLISTWSQEEKKGWTFVEWIFDEVSYLPYLKSDDQSVFYQKFLFRSCLDLYNTDENGNYEQDLCKVYTEDNQNYILKIINENASWSDWMPVTIDDVFFTYDKILRENIRDIPSLTTRDSVKVEYTEDGKIRVIFPTSSFDNINFFVNAILPKHVIENMDLDSYKNYFSLSPITNGCASILPQTNDVNSLIFDLNNCEDTKFAYYQIKNYWSFEDFEWALYGKNQKAIVDVYKSIYWLEWFTGQNVLTSKLLWVFFNTDSGKANVRLRRSIWWLIYHNFFTWDYGQYVDEYDWDFVNYYLSAGENVVDLLNRMSLSEDETVNANDLRDSWAQELPWSMSINWVDRKFVFFMQKPEWTKNLDIKFSNEFSNIKVVASANNSTWSPKNYKTKDKKISYTLEVWKNLNVWVNNFTISGFIKNKTYTIASIDIYVFENLNTQNSEDNQWKLNVLYYNDPASVFAINQMRNIFSWAGILGNFAFEIVDNAEELEWKLLMWSYDMFVWTIDLWSRKDILALFGTEDPLLNPSRYRNPILNSLINQYRKSHYENIKLEINALLAQDMPVILIWNTYEPIQITEDIKAEVFPDVDGEDQKVYAYKWRHDIYSRYGIVHGVRLDFKKAFNLANFENYLYASLFPNRESEKSDQTENISEENTMEGENEIEWAENGEELNSEWEDVQ